MILPEGMSLEDVKRAVRAAIDLRFPPGASGPWPYVEATQEDTVIVDVGGALYSIGWSMDAAGVVTLAPGAAAVIEKTTYEAVTASVSVVRAMGGKKYRIRVLAAGETKNVDDGLPVFFDDSADALSQEARLFAGCKLYGFKFADGTFDHLPDNSVERKWLRQRNEYGFLSDVAVEGTEIHATANLHDDVPAEVLTAIDAAADPSKSADAKPLGLSIDAACTKQKAVRAGKLVSLYTNFRNPSTHPASIDIVTSPAAKGEWLHRVAASIRDRKEKSSMTIAAALAVLALETSTPEQIQEAKRVVASHSPGTAPVTPPVAPAAVLDPAAEARIKELESRTTAALAAAADAQKKLAESTVASSIATAKAEAETLVRASKLPAKSQASIIAAINKDIERDETVRASAVASTQKLIDERRAELAEIDSRVRGSGAFSRLEVGSEPRDRDAVILDRMFMGTQTDKLGERVLAALKAENGGKSIEDRERALGMPSGRMIGPRQALKIITGIDPADWRNGTWDMDRERVRASVGATAMADAWADRLHKIALLYYTLSDYRRDLRKLAKVISVNDFRNVDFVALGGYANLSSVAKNAPYTALSTPSSQGHEFAVGKFGNTESVAWEDIVNDDMQVVQQTPRRLTDAYARTLFEAVADKYLASNLTTDTTDYDSTVWCATSRTPDNYATTAFSDTQLAVVVKLMYQAADFSSSKRLALRPRHVLHPIDLEKTVRDALIATPAERPGITTDYSYAQSLGIEPILIPHWTDATDWIAIADVNGPAPPQVLAFLNGQEEPVIDTQDMRNIGSWFDRDNVTMKVSGVWGNDLVRHEGIFCSEVA
jgi:hypothetical protein